MTFNLMLGDSLERLRELDANSVDSVVTDPPYGLSFMNKHWDYDVPSVDLWREVIRVLKPGGHALIACGTRTQHRMTVNIEDAGFEIRDVITWLYGSGFPKSLDVSKAIDKEAGVEREVIGRNPNHRTMLGTTTHGDEFQPHTSNGSITAPSTDDAKRWQGFGTALKPACEFWTLARKPLERGLTVAANVLKWGCGAINVDASRIGMQAATTYTAPDITGDAFNSDVSKRERKVISVPAQGRWPSNLLLDEDAAAMLDGQSGVSKSTGGTNSIKQNLGVAEMNASKKGANPVFNYGDSGGASRFFYVAKASKRERNAGLEGMPEKDPPGSKRSTPAEGRSSALGAPRANHHPTVKPVKLMEYLVRMITPPGGVCLDPFMGSGSTGVACVNLGFNFIGIERDEQYLEIAKRRIAHAELKEIA